MICRTVGGTLLCEGCSNDVVRFGLVGPGSVFEKACPHVEIVFLEWHEALRAKESPLFRHVWQPFVIGLLFGAGLVFVISDIVQGGW